MKSVKKKIEEGRCQGIGSSYIPLILVEEARSIATATRIPDPIEGRDVHTMSTTETMLYWHIRWDENVRYIREQLLLDSDRINEVRETLGLGRTKSYYSTDFLIDYKDGSQKAYSVKWKRSAFDRNDTEYDGYSSRYYALINRQNIERVYWEEQGVPFSIVTREDLDRTYAANVELVMGYYKPDFIVGRHQKLAYLIAHRIITVDMKGGYLDFERLLSETKIDIDTTYELAVRMKKALMEENI